jgi:uncharacterized repeat protein (TIGR03803 family)
MFEKRLNVNKQRQFSVAFRHIVIFTVALLMAPRVWAGEKVLYAFSGGSDGGTPLAGLILDKAGNLYGTTWLGGALSAGTVFQLTRTAGHWTENVLYSFTGGQDGGNPTGDLIFDSVGNLYGTTELGGKHNAGTVFTLVPNSGGGWSESVLHSFDGAYGGAGPHAGLVFDGIGNLYGTASSGGEWDAGIVFQLSPGSNGQWNSKILYNFKGGRDGAGPYGAVAFDAEGNVYGTTQNGGTSQNAGVVFELTRSSSGHWKEAILHRFTGGKDGGYPYTVRLLIDSSGNLYGTASGGGTYQRGIVFKLAPISGGGWKETVLHNFAGGYAANPWAGLVSDSSGNLYGTCANGNGIYGLGAVFELLPGSNGTWQTRVLHTFPGGSDGKFPEGDVALDSAGNIYGMTSAGGSGNNGTVFEIRP